MTFLSSILLDGYSHERVDDLKLNIITDIHWPRTVQLTLGVRYSFELLFLLQNKALPLLEHLNVAIAGGHLEEDLYHRAPQTIRFCESTIREQMDVSRLRTVVVRRLVLEQVTMFVRSLHFAVLEELTLADLFDHSKSLEERSAFCLSPIS